MRNAALATWIWLAASAAAEAGEQRTARLDFHHTGNAFRESFKVDRVVLEPLAWPGNPNAAQDDSNLGRCRFAVRDAKTGAHFYSRGFSSIFGEWAATAEAKTVERTFHESLRFPMPAAPVQIVLQTRDVANAWKTIWTTVVDPRDSNLRREPTAPPDQLIVIENNGPPAEKVDLLLLGDGYTAAERASFVADAHRMTTALFATAPFKERRRDFNVWALCPPAAASGIARPSAGIQRQSPLGARYDVFGSERYILTFENAAFRAVAAQAPYDFVELLTNSEAYGGGGIFGLYGTVAAKNSWAPYVFVHEFGHHFADLADEYFTSPVAYLPATRRIEPWEPNVTALLDPAKLKWRQLVEPGTPLPTPWQKSEYESWSREYQKRRAAIRSAQRPESEMDALFKENKRVEDQLLGKERYRDKVGAFEGANYAAKGYYRPAANCIMFTRTDFFCPVCRLAIERTIDRYTRPRQR